MGSSTHAGAVQGASHTQAARARRPLSSCLMSAPGFDMALGCTLDLLSGVHSGITLFAVSWLLPPPSEVEMATAATLSPLGSVGRLPDGRIGLGYVEPRSPGGDEVHPDTLLALVRDRVERRLTDAGWSRYAWATRLTTARGWTDEIDGVSDLVARLPAPEPRLIAVG